MLQLYTFFSENKNLQILGLVESSLLFVATRQRIMVAVTDNLMESVCNEMGIEIFKIENRRGNYPNKNESKKELRLSQTSRLSGLIRVACL